MTTRPGEQQRPSEAGSVTAMVAILAIGLLLIVGLVYDGGRILTAKRRAINTAEQAARAGAQEVSIASVRAGGPHRLDPPAAQAAALAYLSQAGYSGAARVRADSIDVDVAWSQPTIILHLTGTGTPGGTVSASARSVHGVTSEEPS
jgi:Putative Flp pilus-assembly TadE/G-like